MSTHGTTILIVEDNELNRRLYQQGLEHYGFSTLQTDRAKDVLNLVRKHRPAAVLMDIQLPEISGLEAIRWIKSDARLRHTPVIAVSALAMEPERSAIMAAGCDAYMAKPVSLTDLAKLLHCHIAARA